LAEFARKLDLYTLVGATAVTNIVTPATLKLVAIDKVTNGCPAQLITNGAFQSFVEAAEKDMSLGIITTVNRHDDRAWTN